ncbi:hypothetical protein SAMN05421771_0723 [Granulicella pectinivorans]|uniref:Uncharacterized protein n=1 Tax=Granulicella pectinivorans TaxID=474950 RepID=A0A1I6LHH9_9BACT|nr:hypothetical protein [Granulicella pectinivorans]SFS02909.1 hypothetical protein SAMN05421771_0723 [Granulicella pectinivorans]
MASPSVVASQLCNGKGYLFMQDVKDTFFVALRDRVASRNPARTVVVRGVVRPGVMVEENELATEWIPTGVFSVRWRDVAVDRSGDVPLAALGCSIRYGTDGDAAHGGMDRGRLLAQMDAELGLALGAGVRNVPKMSFASGAAVALGTQVFWGDVAFGAAVVAGERLERVATVTVFGYLEAGS